MKTETHSVHDVLAKNATSFFIPPFQRAYAWGKPEIERFFLDISKIIESEINTNVHDKLEHFFGTIVIKEEISGFANKSIIIDGQQRITTTLIFLIALRDLESDEEKKKYITNTFLINNSSSFQDKIKLKQVTKDWDSYKALINGEQSQPGAIKNAYDLLKKLIKDKKNINPSVNIYHYIVAIQRLNVAVIFLDERPFKGEDPQIIFETLNSLGKPLTLADLIRNYVLLNMKSDQQTSVYEKKWYPLIENILLEHTSDFFRDYLQYKTISSLKVVNENNTKELYQEFKTFVEENFENKDEFIEDILKYVKCYKWIISEINDDFIASSGSIQYDKEIKELLRNIFHDIKSVAFKPFVLGLLYYHQYSVDNVRLTNETLIKTLKTIRTYLIRRRILGLTQGENQNIVLLSKRIKEIAEGKINMFELLTNLFYSLRFPNDNEIKNVLQTMNFYEELKQYSKFILGKIEEHNSKVSVNFRSSQITIEHIMPQKLNNIWEQELGDNFEEIHKKYLHNIGNLILTEFNFELGNKSFNEKKNKLKNSNLFYRNFIINKNKWNETSIIEHQSKMINCFLETFPVPEEYKEKNNWNSQINYKTKFSPLEDNVDDFVQRNKPIELTIFDETIKVSTWQDVFVKFLKYISDNPKFDFNFIIDNQFELFRREDVILKWNSLKEILNSNPELSNRYKNFNGETFEKVKELNDDMIFIHINISASNCISRISNVMNKLYIDKNSVMIKLK
ncbi:MAG: DUF262 domain-containing HNH endonuclease family protein [candidate division WOR-3 bacterium]